MFALSKKESKTKKNFPKNGNELALHAKIIIVALIFRRTKCWTVKTEDIRSQSVAVLLGENLIRMCVCFLSDENFQFPIVIGVSASVVLCTKYIFSWDGDMCSNSITQCKIHGWTVNHGIFSRSLSFSYSFVSLLKWDPLWTQEFAATRTKKRERENSDERSAPMNPTNAAALQQQQSKWTQKQQHICVSRSIQMANLNFSCGYTHKRKRLKEQPRQVQKRMAVEEKAATAKTCCSCVCVWKKA